MDASVDKRALILDAALRLFVRSGFHGTAVPDISQAAGVGTGTIYRYFPDKEGLVNALFQLWRARFDAAILAPMPRGLSAERQFKLFWERLAHLVRDAPVAARFLELQPHDSYLDETSRQLARAYPVALRNFVRSAIGAGVLREAMPEALIALVHGAMLGLIKQADSEPAGLSPDLIAETGACLWRAIAR